MDRNREKPLPVFINPLTAWTEFTLRLWGFGRPGERVSVPAKPVAVAVIPSSDAPHTAKPKPAKRAAGGRKSAKASKSARSGGRRSSAGPKKAKARGRRSSSRAGR